MATAKQLVASWVRFAMKLPGAELGSRPWGATVVKVYGKAFVSMGIDGAQAAICCKLTDSLAAARARPDVEPNHIGGESGWTTGWFGPGKAVPVRLIESWITESYRTIAPKWLVDAGRDVSPFERGRSARRAPRARARRLKR